MSGLHDLPLRHFSRNELVTPYSVPQPDPADPTNGKPRGLWLSVEDGSDDTYGWSHWCAQESWGIGGYEHVVTVAPDANVLLIEDDQALATFHRRYVCQQDWPRWLADRIDWSAVEADYQGVVITPYLWRMRLDVEVGWYYGWDCASGCIWDADAIEAVTLVGAYSLPEQVDA